MSISLVLLEQQMLIFILFHSVDKLAVQTTQLLPGAFALFGRQTSCFQCLNARLLKFILMLQQSRASSSGKDHLKSTRGSFFNRVVGRQTRPSWGNRIVKDFYDLDYDLTIDRSIPTNPHQFKNTQLLQKQRLKADLLKRTHRKRKHRPNPELESPNKARRRMSLSVGKHRPEKIEIGTLHTTAPNHSGLCPFEFANTIEGKIEKRASHHLSFQKDKLHRILNENPVYYDRHNDLDFSHSRALTLRQQLKKYHPFPSYLERRVFQPRDELDKFFDTGCARKIASPSKIREAVRRFERVLERKEAQLPEGAGLAYEIAGCIEQTKRAPQSYSIQQTARETMLGIQVIYAKRGCRR